MRNLKKYILSVILVCCLLSMGCSNDKNKNLMNEYGNTNSNISNCGLIVSDGENVYVRSSKTSEKYFEEYYIYKYFDEKKEIIAKNCASKPYLNICEDYIYYVGVDDKHENYSIYRTNKDGSNQKKLIGENKILFPMYIKKNIIYYVEYQDETGKISLLSYNLDKEKLERTYYSTKIDIEKGLSPLITNISFDDENNLYIEDATGYKCDIYKINLDTLKKENICSIDSEKDSIVDFIYYENSIYYNLQNIEKGTCKLYKKFLNSNEEILITDKYTDDIQIYRDKIYFTDKDYNICEMDLNGENRKIIKKIEDDTKNIKYVSTKNINILDYIYYESNEINNEEAEYNHNIYKMDLDGKNLEKIDQKILEQMKIIDYMQFVLIIRKYLIKMEIFS